MQQSSTNTASAEASSRSLTSTHARLAYLAADIDDVGQATIEELICQLVLEGFDGPKWLVDQLDRCREDFFNALSPMECDKDSCGGRYPVIRVIDSRAAVLSELLRRVLAEGAMK